MKTVESFNQTYNNGHPNSIVPYEVILFNNGIICKKAPHPVIASHMLICKSDRIPFGLKHDNWPFGFNFITFHYIFAEHDKRVDFMESLNIAHQLNPDRFPNQYVYEACSEFKMGDECYPRFTEKEKAFNHCMKLMILEFNIMEHEQQTRNICIKKLYRQ